MIDKSLFSKYKEIEFKSDGTLFGIQPLDAIKFKVCPYCFNKLYEMRNRPFMYCRSNKHKNRFMIGKDKMK